MSKRRSDTQLTKDDYEAQMNGSFGFTASRAGNSEGGGGRDEADPSKMADSKVMLGRKSVLSLYPFSYLFPLLYFSPFRPGGGLPFEFFVLILGVWLTNTGSRL